MKKNYFSKWMLQRITAFFLIPLSFWFIYQLISFQSFNYEKILFFFKSYTNSILFLIMMISMLIHAKLGCDSIVLDYVSSSKIQKVILNFIYFIIIISILLIIFSVLKLKFIL